MVCIYQLLLLIATCILKCTRFRKVNIKHPPKSATAKEADKCQDLGECIDLPSPKSVTQTDTKAKSWQIKFHMMYFIYHIYPSNKDQITGHSLLIKLSLFQEFYFLKAALN